MSTLICLKENDTLLLGTDSRYMKLDFSGPASDAEQKVHEVAPGTFIATSGRMRACKFQVRRVQELALALGTTDIRKLGTALAGESITCLTDLVEDMRAFQHIEPGIASAVAGRSLLHGCVLVGRDGDGQLGMVVHQYQVRDGVVTCANEEYFGEVRKIVATSGAPPDQLAASFGFVRDPSIWTDPPESVVRRILRDMAATAVSGGADQIVCLDRDGAHWISPPPTAETPVDSALATATINATVSMISPTISGGTITGATLTLNSNGTITAINNQPAGGGTLGNGISVKFSANNQQVFISPNGVWFINSSGQVLGVMDEAVTGNPRGIFAVYNPSNGNSILLDPDNGIFVNGVKLNVP